MSTQDRTPSWPDEQLCKSCFYTAMRTCGICPICGHDGVLPGRAHRTDDRSVCLACANIPETYQSRPCRTEGQIYPHGRCARCALREDLSTLIVDGAADPVAMGTIARHFVRSQPTGKHPHLETFPHRSGPADRALLR
jgi:hypothetical protein